MSEQAPPTPVASFDQIVKGNVCIKKVCKDKYKITFSKIGKFLMYQVWDKDNVNLNKKRAVFYLSAKNWVKAFKEDNKELNKNGKPLFRPTTIMETENSNYAFVIHKADLNSHDQVVFTVSTNEFSLENNTSKKLTRLPEGKCNNVRFDIDEKENKLINLINSYKQNFSKCLGYCYDDGCPYDCRIKCGKSCGDLFDGGRKEETRGQYGECLHYCWNW